MDSASQSKGPVKLKDSCDKCSSSKVKCDRDKPTCGRCLKFGYTCNYSPARRIGRPYQPAKARNDNKSSSDRPVKQVKISRFVNENERLALKFQASSSDDSDNQPNHQPQSGNNDSSRWPTSQIDNLWPSSDSMSSASEEADLLTTFDTGIPASGATISQSVSLTSMDSRFDSSQCSTNGTMNRNNKPRNGRPSSDCAGTVLEILLELEAINSELQCAVDDSIPISAEDVEQSVHNITSNFKCLSTVLVCPCSEKPGIGLLIAAVCNTILDIYNKAADALMLNKDFDYLDNMNDPSNVDHMEICNDGQQRRASTESQGSVDLLTSLTKVAKIVLQTSRRYNGMQLEGTDLEFLSLMAARLKFRLQSVTDQATQSLV